MSFRKYGRTLRGAREIAQHRRRKQQNEEDEGAPTDTPNEDEGAPTDTPNAGEEGAENVNLFLNV